jgi:ABC-type transport system involved in cytochrome c biogenesis permease component
MEKAKLSARTLWKDEKGLGTLEILLILAVLVAVAIVFRKWLIHWVNLLFEQSDSTINQSDQGELVEP